MRKSVLNADCGHDLVVRSGREIRAKTLKPPVITADASFTDDLTRQATDYAEKMIGYAREALPVNLNFLQSCWCPLLLMPAFKPPSKKTPPDGRISSLSGVAK
jgi:hypothetical protein